MTRRIAGPCIIFLALLGASPVDAQVTGDWDPARLQVTRAELEELLSRYQAVIESDGYSSRLREDARQSAARIQERLTLGDFRVGDRIALEVEGEEAIPDTLIVEGGPSVVFLNMGTISLRGVLRSELQDHLTKELGRYIREPVVRASSTIMLSFEGAIGVSGFHVFPSDMILAQALMAAGGPQQAKMDEISIWRGGDRLMEGDEVRQALDDAWTLDQLGLRAGDRIEMPVDQPSSVLPTVFRWGAIITSSLLLGIRVF